jgi:hypothetical protein
MPLLDHFRPPVTEEHQWLSFHSTWPVTIAQFLNQGRLPQRFRAVPNVQLGSEVVIDMVTVRGEETTRAGAEGLAPQPWEPPSPTVTVPVDFTHLDLFEVQVFFHEGGPRLVAAVELVSPANKDRAGNRQAFAIKCASLLQQGVSVIVVDVVTERHANLHAEVLRVLEQANGAVWQSPTNLYAVSYRTVGPKKQARLEMWTAVLTLGAPLPPVPLWLGVDVSVPLDLEATYQAAWSSLGVQWRS